MHIYIYNVIVFKLTIGVFMSDNLPIIRIPESSSTYDNLESILKKAKLIRNLGIASFFVFIFLIVYPVFAIIAIVKIGGTD